MTTRVVRMEDLARELRGFADATLEEQKAAVVRGCHRSLPDLVAASPVDTGLYAQSWRVDADDRRCLIGNTAPHAAVIEYGARPFRPPLKPLLAWAKRVLKDASQPPNYSPQVRALAVGTQKKIEREGMRPRRVLTAALPTIYRNIGRELEAFRNGR